MARWRALTSRDEWPVVGRNNRGTLWFRPRSAARRRRAASQACRRCVV